MLHFKAYLLSYLGFSYLGRGVSLHGCSSKVQPLLLTLVKIYPFKCRVQRIARRDKKAFLSNQCKEIEENNRMGKTRDHQIVNTEIRLIILFANKDGEALYSQQKQDQELTVVQAMNSLLPNSH